MNLLHLEDLSVRLRKRPVLRHIDLTAKAGECIGLIGPNGAGKSTLLRAAMGLVPFTGRSNIAAMPRQARVRHAAFLPQHREIAWPVTVETIASLGQEAVSVAPSRDKIIEAMAATETLSFASRRADSLSGGELARVLLARSLAQDTPLLLADEPVAGLDPAHQIATLQLFKTMAEKGKTVIVSLHDLGLAASWCSRIVLLHQGKILADGKPVEVLGSQALADAFGIELELIHTARGMIVQSWKRPCGSN